MDKLWTASTTMTFVVVLLTTSLFSTSVTAQTFIVNSTIDQIDSNLADGYCKTMDNTCSLRAAIQQANEIPGLDIIQIPAGLYLLDIDTTSLARIDDKSLRGDLDILDAVELVGTGVSPVQNPEPQNSLMTIIDGAGIDRVFDVRTNKNLKLTNLVIQNGQVTSGGGAGINIVSSFSGADTVVMVTNILVRNNVNGGGLVAGSKVNLTVDNSVFYNNSSLNGGAIDIFSSSSTLIRDSLFRSNTALADGGAIHSSSTLTVINSDFDINTARRGGAIYSNNVVLVNSRIKNNQATFPANPLVSYGGGVMLLSVGLHYIHNTVFEKNTSDGFGGGMALFSTVNAILNGDQISNNFAGTGGGGIYSAGNVTLSDSTLSGNTTSSDGAGIHINRNILQINNSAVINNTAQNDSNSATRGGGIYISGGGSLVAKALTVSGNKSIGNAGEGGGLYLDRLVVPGSGVLWSNANIGHGSLIHNEATNGGNIAANAENSGELKILNTVMLHSPSPGQTNCGAEFSSLVPIAITPASANIASDTSCGAAGANWTIADPGLNTSLAFNGGALLNHQLLSTSVAINKSQSIFCDAVDQRYFVRDITDGMCDIGATEFTTTPLIAGTVYFERDISVGENYLVSELAGSVALNVLRSPNATGDVSIQYRTVSGSAIENSDYTPTVGTLDFSGNTTSLPISVPVTNDFEFEFDEKFSLELFNPTGGVSLDVGTVAEVQIQDSGRRAPQAGSFSFVTTKVTVGESSGAYMVTVQRKSGSDLDVSVDLELVTGGFTLVPPAIVGEDFVYANGPLQFPHGVTEQAFFIDLIDDNIYEGNKEIRMKLVNPQGGGGVAVDLVSSTLSLTIDDDELRPPMVEFVKSLPITINEGDPFDQTLLQLYISPGESLSGGGVGSFDYRVSGGSATQGVDFELIAGTINYDPTDPGRKFIHNLPLAIINDTEIEVMETIAVELLNAQGNMQLGSTTTALVRIIDNDSGVPANGELAFEQIDYIVDEVAQTYKINVVRTGGTDGTVSVDFDVTSGDATLNQDFRLTSGSLTFNQGESIKPISITIIDDTQEEPAETIQLSLSNPLGGATIGLTQTTVTIKANDQPIPTQGELGFEQALYTTEEANKNVTINVVRKGGSSGAVAVDYKILLGSSASLSEDYLLNEGTLQFADSVLSQPIVIQIIDDSIAEFSESILLELSNSTNGASIGLSQTNITIDSNDQPVPGPSVVKFASAKMSVSESQFIQTIDVIRTGTVPASFTVDYQVTGGSATQAEDYGSLSGSLYFGAGDAQKTISLVIFDDFDVEPDETIELTLSATNPQYIGTPATLVITITDDDSDAVLAKPGGGGGGGSMSLYEIALLYFALIYGITLVRKENP